MRAVIVLCALLCCNAAPLTEKAAAEDLLAEPWAAITDSTDKTGASIALAANTARAHRAHDELNESDLLQVGTQGYVPDYPGCAYGYFWCSQFKNVGISASDAAKLSASTDPDHDEWFYNGKPTCVGRGAHYQPCLDSDFLVCAGGDEYGRGDIQAGAIKAAIDNGGVHPECPGCTVGRQLENSTTTCYTPKGQTCDYQCQSGHRVWGARTCQDNGTFTGGSCEIPPVDTSINELHETMSPSASPSPWPSYIPPTPQDVAHENWTKYEEDYDFRETAEYNRLVAMQTCLYLLDLENFFHDVMFLLPRKPLRAELMVAAKAAECAWVHDAEFATAAQRDQPNPRRGDHGPWPNNLHPNVLHIKVKGYGEIAVHVDLEHGTGKDVYRAFSERMGINPDQFSLYLPNSIHPVDENAPLSKYGFKFADVLEGELGRRTQLVSQDQDEGAMLTWRRGAVRDPNRGPIAP